VYRSNELFAEMQLELMGKAGAERLRALKKLKTKHEPSVNTESCLDWLLNVIPNYASSKFSARDADMYAKRPAVVVDLTLDDDDDEVKPVGKKARVEG
jgi:hypothetical protein